MKRPMPSTSQNNVTSLVAPPLVLGLTLRFRQHFQGFARDRSQYHFAMVFTVVTEFWFDF